MPITLVLLMTVLFVLAQFQHQHAQNFHGASGSWRAALSLSAFLAFAALTALFIYYFFKAPWYWPFVLFAVVTGLGGLVYGLIKPIVPFWVVSLSAFVGWPAAAIGAFFVLQSLGSSFKTTGT